MRPQCGERCESQPECDSALGAKSDENDVELNGEMDDEDMDGETVFDDGNAQVRKIRDQGQPTVKERQEHMTTHLGAHTADEPVPQILWDFPKERIPHRRADRRCASAADVGGVGLTGTSATADRRTKWGCASIFGRDRRDAQNLVPGKCRVRPGLAAYSDAVPRHGA